MAELALKKEQFSFIDEYRIWSELSQAQHPVAKQVEEVLERAREKKGLTTLETAVLLQNEDKELDEAIFEVARQIKLEIYGNRIVLFAPLYISNECGNSCSYCGFAARNKELHRKTLNATEIREEVQTLEELGHKRLLLVYGERSDFNGEHYAKDVETVYSVKSGKSGEIRRLNVNLAPLSVEDFRILKGSGIGTYQCFQETYHRDTYEKVHLSGRKKDFLWRLYALHRAQEAGIDDVAMGALFGLFNHKFEVLALLMHAQQLEKDFGVGPHTISFPRIEPALGAAISYTPPNPVDNYNFKKVVAILRIMTPYTGLILTTRENADFRKELLKIGVSQMSAGSRTYPGAYRDSRANLPDKQQFTIGDTRSLDEVIFDLSENLAYIPSFCTACYRLGRTGDHFMGLAKSSFINKFCQPNALLTFKEYLNDYASDRTRASGQPLISRELLRFEDNSRCAAVEARLKRIDDGERDLYF
ncbi:[FeFe] hydrogenase H-cluster radical SAM maturase HydG [Desulfomonile tiedjei]|uniref:Iron-only hydrogenase maturation protein HydG n=1 Tax=Desulfomonile tiedjei (strain ATCC 49306 / DSM 6799 / DCB-1) TaxID=706587 RepID=I4CDX0_DESTA|nr:[FeFe] hydrogenase H-cluster radical SAM maturase HydG [Desulfomonile tiedjei]AFM27761.1 iron-only hydrogenase maturation protein HydG [Desulfomonile tiedjei DSM 6799]